MKYSLYDNKITKNNPDDCFARTVELKVNTRDDLVNNVTREGSILKTTESNAVIDSYWNEIGNFISKGEGYRDEYVNVKFDFQGVFSDFNDRFDPTRHTIVVNVVLSAIIADRVKEISLQYKKAKSETPMIEVLFDWGSDTSNKMLTPGGVVEIEGEELKIYQKPGEGVFFINQSDGMETNVEYLRKNTPRTLSLQVPPLTRGQYRLEIRNTTRNGTILRTDSLAKTFEVS